MSFALTNREIAVCIGALHSASEDLLAAIKTRLLTEDERHEMAAAYRDMIELKTRMEHEVRATIEPRALAGNPAKGFGGTLPA